MRWSGWWLSGVVLWSALARAGTPGVAEAGTAWSFKEIAPGVELSTPLAPMKSEVGDSRLTVVRIDPAKRPLRLYGIGALKLPEGLTAEQWARNYGLLAVINAGMFETDYRTPTGCSTSVPSGAGRRRARRAAGPPRRAAGPGRRG